MLTENQNIKDTTNDLGISIKDMEVSVFSKKANKLITALFMVTDIIETTEPLRNKLRTLGIEIISDMSSIPAHACNRISEVVSFLDIASAINIISRMNCHILKKEFLELNHSIRESIDTIKTFNAEVNLSDFFTQETFSKQSLDIRENNHVRRQYSTRIGIQKGGTLMKALSDKTHLLSNKNSAISKKDNFDELKKHRRENIINIIKSNGQSASIKDIKTKFGTGMKESANISEKTLQRELMSMTKDGILDKTGEKRWSKYSIRN